ncbi:hypothetical protein F5Y04DRAFT_242423 [Hypomontagnella monticulosa]|nr:hypothetical protein F5Y04DRAFT_242423 [Hypomontagnella monticulosa]
MSPFKGSCNLWLSYYWRFIIPTILLITSSYFLFERNWPAQWRQASIPESHETLDAHRIHIDPSPEYGDSNITVNLVMATLLEDDISWTENIRLPNLNIIRYVSDDMGAEYHPPIPYKGREALIYLTYLHDFYDNLPDITIFSHADESPWHLEHLLNSSMVFALSHLDLDQVLRRQYFNLRVSWKNACPDWINTTMTEGESAKKEQPHMHQAFNENFPANHVPEILAGPCCSQFAVTRDAVRRHPRSQYRLSIDWLVQTELEDYISGRIWEHFWPWLFRGESVDCPIEWKSYCTMYHICFDSKSRNRLVGLEDERDELKLRTGFLDKLADFLGGMKAKKRLEEIDAIMATELKRALERGKSEAARTEILSDRYNTA